MELQNKDFKVNEKLIYLYNNWRYSGVRRSAYVTSLVSQLLLTQFRPNFEGRFLGPFSRDSYCNSDICPSKICPGDICSFQKYLSYYWFDFDQTLNVGSWDHLTDVNCQVTFFQATLWWMTPFPPPPTLQQSSSHRKRQIFIQKGTKKDKVYSLGRT